MGYLSALGQGQGIGGVVVATQTEIRTLLECHVVGSDGQLIGNVGQVYLGDRSGEPEWITVRTGFFGMRQTFVPLAAARRSGGEIRVPYDREAIKGAPNIGVDGRLTLKEEIGLYRYYGMQPSVPAQRTGDHDR
jgi:sporulation protein YlmC with PRC-barrel domain